MPLDYVQNIGEESIITPLWYNYTMALNIKNPKVEKLVNEVVAITGESKTEAIRKALEERQARLSFIMAESKEERLLNFLNEDVWPLIPADLLGKEISQEEQDEILGFGILGI